MLSKTGAQGSAGQEAENECIIKKELVILVAIGCPCDASDPRFIRGYKMEDKGAGVGVAASCGLQVPHGPPQGAR